MASHAPARPDRDRAFPLPVVVLCGALLAVYGFELAVAWRGGAPELEAWLHAFGLVPREVVSGRWYTLVSSIFLHAGLVHVLSNVAFLAYFGRALASRLGGTRLLLLFFASGVAAAGLHVAADPGAFVTTLGASGALAGWVGAFVRLRAWRRDRPDLLAFGLVGLWWLATLSGPGVAAWAHLGGFLAGFLSAPQLASVTPRTR